MNEEIGRYFTMNENRNTIYQNMEMSKGKFSALNLCVKKDSLDSVTVGFTLRNQNRIN